MLTQEQITAVVNEHLRTIQFLQERAANLAAENAALQAALKAKPADGSLNG